MASRRGVAAWSRRPDEPGSSFDGATGTRPTRSCAPFPSAAVWPEPGPVMAIPAHEATTRHLGALYPFLCEPGLGFGGRGGRGGGGVLVGRDLLGATFSYDP